MERTTSGARTRWPLKAANVPQRRKRNGYAIHGYTGSNGGGKTLAAVYDSLPALAAGRPVVSTCRILDPRTGEPHPLWVPLDDFRLLLEVSYCDVILDEVTGVASSRESMSLPAAIGNHLNQLRKDDVKVRWTTPNWKRADTIIREVTQAVTTCIGFVPQNVRETTDDGLIREWRQRRAFLWRTYDAQKFDEWSTAKERSSSKQHRQRPVVRQLTWGPGSITQDCYDTYERALSLGVVSDAGMCMDCGGNRTRRKCSCVPGEAVHDPSRGMRMWREVDLERRRGGFIAPDPEPVDGRHVLIEETDETPGVLVDLT